MARFMQGSGPIYRNNVDCTGTEMDFLSCTFDSALGSCSHSNDAGVGCRAERKSANIILRELATLCSEDPSNNEDWNPLNPLIGTH